MSNSYKEYASKEYVDSKTPPIATTEADGLMSAADKSKLDGVAVGAEVNVQADWNVNDETSDTYVQNRPFYITEPQEVVWYDGEIDDYGVMIGHELNLGQTYTVICNGTTYTCVGVQYGQNGVSIGSGNAEEYPFMAISGSNGVNGTTGIDFNIEPPVSLKISTIEPVYKQLDEKYISYKPGLRVGGNGAEIFNATNNKATATCAHAEGYSTEATGEASHAEGFFARASGDSAHAEGCDTGASGDYSHAEGEGSVATGRSSHAENSSTATGDYSHAENGSEAKGYGSHAEGKSTASGEYQHTQGKYNIEDTENKYAHIVGNGSFLNDRSNAHTLDWDGTAWFKGSVKVGGTGQDDNNAKTLATTDVATAESNGLMSAADKVHVDSISTKMDKENPTGTGTLSLNAHQDTELGNYSVALGYESKVSGQYSAAMGYRTEASGDYSHAVGYCSLARGANSSAEGKDTRAFADNSHTEGWRTVAYGETQHVQGKYNNHDNDNKYAHIVGNGTDSVNLSNAHTLDWNGTAWFAGDVKVGGTGQDDATAKTLATTDVATTTADGLMSAADKTKLDAVPTDAASKTYVDETLGNVEALLAAI